jgi:hypothetical protein
MAQEGSTKSCSTQELPQRIALAKQSWPQVELVQVADPLTAVHTLVHEPQA